MDEPLSELDGRLFRLRKGHAEKIRARVAEIEAAWNGTQGSIWSEQLLHALERDDLAGPGLARLEMRAALAEMLNLASDLNRSCAALGFLSVCGAAGVLAGRLADVLGRDGNPSAEEEAALVGLLRALRRAARELDEG